MLIAVIGTSSIMINDSATKSPLMFSKWPPSYQNGKSQSLRHQIFHQLRSSGRIPSPSMLVKRYPSSPMSVMMRPMKYAQLKKQPLPQPSYYRPTISTPPRYRFNSSPQAPNTGEYIFENPFNNLGLPPVRIHLSHLLKLTKKKRKQKINQIHYDFNENIFVVAVCVCFIFRIRKSSVSLMTPNIVPFILYQHQI